MFYANQYNLLATGKMTIQTYRFEANFEARSTLRRISCAATVDSRTSSSAGDCRQR